jgi:hypothetical protein
VDTNTIALVAGLAILAWLLLSASTIMKIIQIRRTPTTWISALPSEGRVEVMGLAGQKTLESPINKSPCVLWQLEVKEERKEKNRSSWSTVYKGSSVEPFEVYDETGKVQIKPTGADLMLAEDWSTYNPDPKTMSILTGLGISTTNWLGFDKNFRISESLIAPDEQVYVIGEVQECDGCKSIARNSHTLVISDRSERDLLIALYKKLALYAAMVLVGAIALYYFVINGYLRLF